MISPEENGNQCGDIDGSVDQLIAKGVDGAQSLDIDGTVLRRKGLTTGLHKEVDNDDDRSSLEIVPLEELNELSLLHFVLQRCTQFRKFGLDLLLGEGAFSQPSKIQHSLFISTLSEKPAWGLGDEPDQAQNDGWNNVEETERNSPGSVIDDGARAEADAVDDEAADDETELV